MNRQWRMTAVSRLMLVVMGVVLWLNICDAQKTLEPPDNPNSAKACAICHYRWVDTFFIEGRSSELADYTAEKMVATPEMCYSCHDGSVADSRAWAYHNRQHTVDKRPPADMQIPKSFPLDEGKMNCATCHTPHALPSGPESKEIFFMRVSNRNSAMCPQCHADWSGGMAAGNHPLGSFEKPIPQLLINGGAKVGEKPNQLVCQSCHVVHGSPTESLLAKPSDDSSLCLACHQDLSPLTPNGQKRPVHVVNVVPKTASIPVSLEQDGARRGKSGEIICLTCHRVHKNKAEPHLLVVEKGEKDQFCLLCHADKKYIGETKHNLAVSAPREKNLEGKTAAEAGVCSACHLPHKPARQLTGEGDYTARLCMSCHSKGGVAEKVNLIGTTHPLSVYPFAKRETDSLRTTISVQKEELRLPLYDANGVRNIDGKMTCSTCHETHQSPPQAAGARKKIKSFLRELTPQICKECHRDKFLITDTKHNLKISAPAEKNILKQTPAESGLCGSCHLVHGPQKNFLWARASLAEDKQKGAESLCISCHNETGIAKKKVHRGYSHPMRISVPQKGATKALPLFDRHGKISPKGTMNCQTCHDPHRWQPVSSAAKTVREDPEASKRFSSFLREASPKICDECHHEKFQIANTDHDLSRSAPEAKNMVKQTAAESGLCGSCHLVHNAQKTFLWARSLKDLQDEGVQKLCVSCHNAEGPAAKKTLSGYSHPLNITPSEKGISTTLPLFDKDGQSMKRGLMTCQTCHDSHRWSPSSTDPAKGHFGVEGNAQNSFLRISNSPLPTLCENCHPQQGVVAKTDHDLLLSAPQSKNSLDEVPAESGVCGTCHLVHNSQIHVKLWARPLSGGGGIIEQMCNSCHSKAGPANIKVPLIASHPDNVLIINRQKNIWGEDKYLPLFDGSTGKRIKVGNISCPSCHNAHQWDTRSKSKGKGTREGSAMNSFLRAPSYQLICNDCHGPDALFKYLYFHDPTKRTGRKNLN
ncbi:MAG: cytochrome c3 family protein [Desulfobacterales bacterium]